VTTQDILAEARAIDKLQENKKHKNLVTITEHGWLAESWFYYIDMELCQGNLDDYLHEKKTLTYESSSNPRFFNATLLEKGDWYIWDIMEQISKGIEFIHSRTLVHRDLKPRNGNLSVARIDLQCCSLPKIAPGKLPTLG
jgi:serine/threonine protein kinase